MVYYSVSVYNRDMLFVGILSWWYKDGLLICIDDLKLQLNKLSDIFSIGLLFKTLFSPFRQISVNSSGRSLKEKLMAMFDRFLSRIIGSIVRLFMIILGSLLVIINIVFSAIVIMLWVLLPAMPVIGIAGAILL